MQLTIDIHNCPICDHTMEIDRPEWVYQCPSCGYLRSTLIPTIGELVHDSALNEVRRENALSLVRQENFERILQLLDQVTLPGKKLLDVGCAHGWFLKAAKQRGYEAYGLEPDAAIGSLTRQLDLVVWTGFFPNDLPDEVQFDIIVFNDVFEHLLDVAGAMMACVNRLTPQGILVINLPSSRGVFYRLAALLRHVGFSKPFDRMWQRNFPSPHISYFKPIHLQRLAAKYGLTEIQRSTLLSISLKGLWSRLRYDTSASIWTSILIFLGITFLSPFIRYLPADISVQFFRKC